LYPVARRPELALYHLTVASLMVSPQSSQTVALNHMVVFLFITLPPGGE
jgi:hypothetical protein